MTNICRKCNHSVGDHILIPPPETIADLLGSNFYRAECSLCDCKTLGELRVNGSK